MTTLTKETRKLAGSLEAIQLALCSKSFLDFLDYVFVMEPPPGRGTIKFAKWPHIMEMAAAFEQNRRIVVLKSRQIGFSWLVSIFSVWTARFKPGAVILLLSQGQIEAYSLMDKLRFVYSHLPESWQIPLSADSRSEMRFENGSAITALPSTESAGRGFTSSLVIQDEAERHEHIEENVQATWPTATKGGTLILGSTSDKRKHGSVFKETYLGAPDNGWSRFFFGWNVIEGRDSAWFEKTKREVPSTSTGGLTPDQYMEQEFPATANEALAPAKTMAAFNQDVLRQMEEEVRKPVETDGVINIYQRWTIGRRYACGTDTSHGVGQDYSVSVVLDLNTGYIVADILENRIPPEELAYQTIQMLGMYRNPIWGIEDNEWGAVTLRDAEKGRYPRIFHRETGRGNREKGWHTDKKSRHILWGELIEAVDAGQIIVPSKEGIAQFFSVIRDASHGGRPEAIAGAHDDYPTAVAIAWQLKEHAYGSGGKLVMMPARW